MTKEKVKKSAAPAPKAATKIARTKTASMAAAGEEAKRKKSAMTDKERREKSDEEKEARGERRVTCWISAKAAAALDKLTENDASRGAIKSVLDAAIVAHAARVAARQRAEAKKGELER